MYIFFKYVLTDRDMCTPMSSVSMNELMPKWSRVEIFKCSAYDLFELGIIRIFVEINSSKRFEKTLYTAE